MGELDLVVETWPGALNELEAAFEKLFRVPQIRSSIDEEHIQKTPHRVAEVFKELYSGCAIDPYSVLATKFGKSRYNEMINVNDIQFVSSCAHHVLPFMGKAHFSYMPGASIVGLSKIPRLIKVLSRRPQVQEKLTQEIVNVFDDEMEPQGCGLVMEAIHLCMAIRGVECETAYTRTTALAGNYLNPTVKAEFLGSIRKTGGQLWP